MHLLKTDLEPNRVKNTLVDESVSRGHETPVAPVGHIDWRQHYRGRDWCYDSLLDALSSEYVRAQARAADTAREASTKGSKFLDAV